MLHWNIHINWDILYWSLLYWNRLHRNLSLFVYGSLALYCNCRNRILLPILIWGIEIILLLHLMVLTIDVEMLLMVHLSIYSLLISLSPLLVPVCSQTLAMSKSASSCAVTSMGAMHCWGNNDYGMTTDRSTAVAVSGMSPGQPFGQPFGQPSEQPTAQPLRHPHNRQWLSHRVNRRNHRHPVPPTSHRNNRQHSPSICCSMDRSDIFTEPKFWEFDLGYKKKHLTL